MDLDIGLIPGLLVLAEEGHYGRAAARLHLTSSALTKRVQRLEHQVGVPLVERGPAGVLGLSAAGERFVDAAGPLLAQAATACRAARGDESPRLLRIGFPAETNFQRRIGLAGLVRDVRRSHPEVRVTCIGVPFRELNTSLTDDEIDVLCTIAPVRQSGVDSFPLQVTSARIGVVGARHHLAEAGQVDVTTFAEQPTLYNPSAPPEWMNPFWLGDVRPASQARLVAITAQDQGAVLRQTMEGTGVISTLATVSASLGPHLRAVRLTGASPVDFHVAQRHSDRRGAVRALVGAFMALPPQDLS